MHLNDFDFTARRAARHAAQLENDAAAPATHRAVLHAAMTATAARYHAARGTPREADLFLEYKKAAEAAGFDVLPR